MFPKNTKTPLLALLTAVGTSVLLPAPVFAGYSFQVPAKGLRAPAAQSPQIPQNCSAPWGATVANGGSVTAYAAPVVAAGTECQAETRSCTNGVLTGTYTSASCEVSAPPGITVVSARYYASNGNECNALPKVSALADGKTTYTLTISAYSVVCTSDPWSGHSKQFEAYYTCGGAPSQKYITFAGGSSGTFRCP